MEKITFVLGGERMFQIPEGLKTRIATLIPEDVELQAFLGNNDLTSVVTAIKGYYVMTDTVCRALQGASEEEKTKRPDLLEIAEKWGPRYEQLEEIFDELSAITP